MEAASVVTSLDATCRVIVGSHMLGTVYDAEVGPDNLHRVAQHVHMTGVERGRHAAMIVMDDPDDRVPDVMAEAWEDAAERMRTFARTPYAEQPAVAASHSGFLFARAGVYALQARAAEHEADRLYWRHSAALALAGARFWRGM